jgi:hypothetical protein
VVEVSGPLGGFVSALAGLPVADIGVDTFTLEDTILRLLGERRS